MNILFVCARNQWRSPTAEAIYSNDPRVNVRSAGLRDSAKRRIGIRDLEWADVIFVMERKQKLELMDRFVGYEYTGQVFVLDIPDDFQFMDPVLQELIRNGVEPVIEGGDDR